jgi:hypothetical protein
MQSTKAKKKQFLKLKQTYTNENLTSFVRNSNSIERIIEYNNRLYQKIDPIYLEPRSNFIKSHFYAPHKIIFGKYIDTFWMNIMVIWFFILFLYIGLHFRILRKTIEYIPKLKAKFDKESDNL